MKRIVVDGDILGRGPSGSATYTRQLVDALSCIPDTDVQVFGENRARSPSKAVNAVADTWWAVGGPRRRASDLSVSPCNTGVAGRAPHLLVVYDALVIDHPERYDTAFARWWRAMVPISVRHATKIVTISSHSADRLQAWLGPLPNLAVIPPYGREPAMTCRRVPSEREVLLFGTTEPHKRTSAGIALVAETRLATGADLRLHVAGRPGRAEPDVEAALRAHDPDGSWSRRSTTLDDRHVLAMLDESWLLLQPSEDEGFGLPVLEAAGRGLPVLHSGAGAMSEVLPGGSWGTSPAMAIAELLDDGVWQSTSQAVRARSATFSPGRFRSEVASVVGPLIGLAA